MGSGKPTTFDHTIHVSFTELVATLNLSRPGLQRMIDGGYIVRGKDGLYQLNLAVQGAIRHTKDNGLKRGNTRDLAQIKVQEARARSIDQATALQARELILYSEHCAVVDTLIGGAKSELDGMPAQLTRDRELRVEYEKKFNDMMQRLSDKWLKMAQSGEEDSEEDEE